MKLLLLTLTIFLFALSANAQVVLVKDITPGTISSNPWNKHVFKDKLIFCASWQIGCSTRLWRCNDTSTSMISPTLRADVEMMTVGNKFFFSAEHPTLGYELYMWNGVDTPSLTKDIAIGPTSSFPMDMVSFNNKLFFTATTASVISGPLLRTLCVYDPASDTLRRIHAAGFGPIIFNNKVYFLSDKLYFYDPLLDTVLPAANYPAGNFEAWYLTVCNNKMYIDARTNDYGYELYVYDGLNPPLRITDLTSGPGNSMPSQYRTWGNEPHIVGYKGSVYFNASKDSSFLQLYKYDPGIDAGVNNPSFVYDLSMPVYDPASFIEYNGKLYFQVNDNLHGTELWMYDGVKMPSMVADVNPGKAGSDPRHFAIYRNTLYFTATTATTGRELYKLGENTINIENVSRVNDLQVYPNPATNTIHFDIDLKTECAFAISLTDVSGREVYNGGIQQHEQGKTSAQADVLGLATGNYYYRIITSEGITLGSGKIIKQ